MTKVSVIIPVYNMEKYLRQALDSLVNQTLREIEIICVNDGSTDNSLNILKEYQSRDKRIKIINQNNQGTGIARNNGIENSSGEYIAFCDPDDWYELNALEKLYNFALSNNAQIVQYDYKEYNDCSFVKFKKIKFTDNLRKKYKKNLFFNLKSYNRHDFKQGILLNLDSHAWNRIYSSDFVKKNRLQFAPTKRGEDHLFVNGAILLADRTYYYPEFLYIYRVRQGSAVNSQGKDNLDVFLNLDLMRDFIVKHNLYDELKDQLDFYNKTVLLWQYSQTLPEDKSKYLDLCKKYLPEKEYADFVMKINNRRSFIENIFSLKNDRIGGIKHKVVTVLWISFILPTKKNK